MTNKIVSQIKMDIDRFFAKWIETTELAYQSKYLTERMGQLMLQNKPDIINNALYWSAEKCGRKTCIKIHYTWLNIMYLKYAYMRKHDEFKIFFQMIESRMKSFAFYNGLDPIVNIGIIT